MHKQEKGERLLLRSWCHDEHAGASGVRVQPLATGGRQQHQRDVAEIRHLLLFLLLRLLEKQPRDSLYSQQGLFRNVAREDPRGGTGSRCGWELSRVVLLRVPLYPSVHLCIFLSGWCAPATHLTAGGVLNTARNASHDVR